MADEHEDAETPEDELNTKAFIAAFWLGAKDWNRRSDSLRGSIPDVPAALDLAEIRGHSDKTPYLGDALAGLEERRAGRNPAPARLLTAFALGFAAAGSRFTNRIWPSEWRERKKRVETALEQLDGLAESVDALDSDLIHGPKNLRAALDSPSSEPPREAIRVLRKWIAQNRPDPADTAEHETTIGDGRARRPGQEQDSARSVASRQAKQTARDRGCIAQRRRAQ